MLLGYLCFQPGALSRMGVRPMHAAEEVMAFGDGGGEQPRSSSPSHVADPRIHEAVRAAQHELQQLTRQRAEIVKRIGTMKQTLAGLARLYGDDVLSDEMRGLLHRKPGSRAPGLTDTCRLVLMEADRPLSAWELCGQLELRIGSVLLRHKDRLASVTTILNRLVQYGEARAVVFGGRRAWLWSSEAHEIAVRSAEPSSGFLQSIPAAPGHGLAQRQAK
jgi:hypothetical protein